jgi:hypothetical protein
MADEGEAPHRDGETASAEAPAGTQAATPSAPHPAPPIGSPGANQPPDAWDGGAGPGLTQRSGTDPALVAAALFVALGWTPTAVWMALLGVAYFGPLHYSAILAIVGVLAAAIAVLRSLDTGDLRLRRYALAIGGIGMGRLFVLPFF